MNMIVVGCLLSVCCRGCLSYSHSRYVKRASAARAVPEGESARQGRIYFVSFPENCLAAPILGWHPCIGHASLVTKDGTGKIKQYDYGWFCGGEGDWPADAPSDAIEYKGESPSYGLVRRKTFSAKQSANATNDVEIAKMVLEGMSVYGDKVEIWAKDVDDIGIAERYFEQLAADEKRGSMAWRCWQIGGYRCGNITRQAFDAARCEYHWLDLLWGGFPGADAPSIGTEKTTWSR